MSEYLVERLILAGTEKICFIIAPGKADILEFYGTRKLGADLAFVVQPQPAGLSDAVFRALPLIPAEEYVIIGLPDTVWFPEDALMALPNAPLSLLLFPVEHPQYFDAVRTTPEGRVTGIEVKSAQPTSRWIWGAIKMRGSVLRELFELWCERQRKDEFLGTLIDAWIARGGEAHGIRAGEMYLDVGTVHGYRDAMQRLSGPLPYTPDLAP